MTHLLGIDFGTTGFKIHLFTEDGISIACRQGKIPVSYPQSGWVEQDAITSWNAISQEIRGISQEAGTSHKGIDVIAITGTSHVTLWDEVGKPLYPAILYGDIRLPGESAIQRILTEIGADRIGSVFGLTKASDNQLQIILRFMVSTKLVWLWQQKKDISKLVRSWTTNGWDFLNYKLTGQTAYLQREYAIEREVATLFGLPDACWGKPMHTGDVVGQVSANAARETGLAEGTPVVIGTRDSVVGFLGAGITQPGMALNQCGTTDVVAVSFTQQKKTGLGYPVESLLPGLWLNSLSPIRGPMVNWAHDLLLTAYAPYSELDELAAQAPPGSEGLICLPYLCGEKAIFHDSQARAVFVGLDRMHGKSHIARAVLEGIAYGIREILAAYKADGYTFNEIRVGGGGAQSHLWNQIKADVLESPISVLSVLETGCLGAAMIAAKTMNIYKTLLEASQKMVHVSRVIDPQPQNAPIYNHAIMAYEMIYPGCRGLFPLLEEIRNGFRSGMI
jgi:xylulokinase